MDVDEVLKRVREQGARELTLNTVSLPNGVRLEGVQIDTPQDAELFRRALAELAKPDPLQAILGGNAPPRKPAAPTLLLSDAIATHLGDLERAKRDPKTVLESRHSLRLLLGIVGDMPASELSQEHARAFFDGVRHWPKNASKRPEYRRLNVAQVMALSKKNGEPEPAAHTLNKHRQRLSAFVHPLLASRVLAHNPLAGVLTMTDHAAGAEVETGRPFTADELRTIFEPAAFLPWAAKYPHRFWGPLLGLYSGARVTEVAQLYLADIETIDGVPGFHINRRFPGQKIKNAQSRRFVPLAQPLLDAGFLGFVEEVRGAGHERLFPHLPNGTGLGFGRQLSRQFSDYLKRQGLEEAGLGFHAFRHTFATLLDEAGEDLKAISRLTGHLDGKAQESTLERFYLDRKTLPLRVATLTKFVPPVTPPDYQSGQFREALKVAASKEKRRARSPKSKAPA